MRHNQPYCLAIRLHTVSATPEVSYHLVLGAHSSPAYIPPSVSERHVKLPLLCILHYITLYMGTSVLTYVQSCCFLNWPGLNPCNQRPDLCTHLQFPLPLLVNHHLHNYSVPHANTETLILQRQIACTCVL